MHTEIKKARLERNMTQDELAEKVGTSKSYISEIERGKAVPSVIIGQRVAKTLRAPLSKLWPIDGAA